MYMNQAVSPNLPVLEALRQKMTLIKLEQQKRGHPFQGWPLLISVQLKIKAQL
jgi:hypothetical protein